MRWIAPLASLQVELWGVAGALGNKAVILRDLNRLQKWAGGHTTEFNKTKHEALHPRQVHDWRKNGT